MAGAVAFSAGAAEPDADSTTYRLPESVVTAARLPANQIPISEFPANVTVLTRKDIENSPAFTVPELLRQQVGISITDTVGFGQSTKLTMRGFSDKPGTLILVDGVRVNDAGSSTYLWNTVPLENIERIEIIRGGASTTYGEGAIAGVVNIITKTPLDRPLTATVSGAGGNLGYYNGHLEISGRTNLFSYYLSGDRQEWDGWRDVSGYRSWSAHAKPSLKTSFGQFTLDYHYHWSESEDPGTLSRAQFKSNPRQRGGTQTFFENDLHRAHLDYHHTLENGLALLGKVHGQLSDSISRSAFGTGDIDQPNYGTTIQVSYDTEIFTRPNTWTVGAEAIQQDFESVFDSAFGQFATVADHGTASAFVQDTLKVHQRVSIFGGARFDYREWDIAVRDPFSPAIDADRSASVWSPKAGVQLELARKVNGWFSWSRPFRLPDGFDISTAGAAPGQLFFANPTIDPVRSDTYEVGLRSDRCKYLSGGVTYFYSDVKNDIVFDPAAFMNQNFDSTRQGVELNLNSAPAEWIGLYFNTAYTDARFDGGPYDDNRLPHVPEWQFNGGINFYPFKGWTLTFEATHVRNQPALNDLNNAFDANDYTVLNAKVRYQYRALTFFASVNNLLDERYELFPTTRFFPAPERRFNPAPGINFQIGATATF